MFKLKKQKDMNLYKDEAEIYSEFANSSFSWEFLEKPAFDYLFASLKKTNLKVLDAGCGGGRIIRYLIKRGISPKNIVGQDISPEMIKIAKKNFPKLSFIQRNMRSTNLPRNSLDLITCTMAIHDLDEKDFRKTLKNFHRLLKDGGTFFYIVSHPIRVINGNMNLYFNEGWQINKTPWGTKLPYFHRTVETYIKETTSAGFLIKNLYEPSLPLNSKKVDSKSYESYSKFPARLVITAIKT